MLHAPSFRVRPENAAEAGNAKHRNILRTSDEMVFVDAKINAEGAPGICQRYTEKQFAFDRSTSSFCLPYHLHVGRVTLEKEKNVKAFYRCATSDNEWCTMQGRS